MFENTRFWTEYLWLICISITIIGSFYSILATYFIGRFARQAPTKKFPCPPVTLLKPLHQAESGLFENLTSFCEQEYPAPIQIIFGVSHSLDPAVAVVKDIQSTYPDLNISLVCDETQNGENQKISNVINMFKMRQHSIIILSDSDIRVEKNYLKTIAAAMAEENVGIVSLYYRGLPLNGFWSKMTACHIDHNFFPSALLGTSLGLTSPCFGSTLAISDSLLRRIGGFERYASDLADDFAMGQKVKELGKTISLPPVILQHTCAEKSFFEYFLHLLRWGQTIKSINPLGYLGSIVTHPLPFIICASLLKPTDLSTYILLCFSLASRMLIPLQMKYKFQAEGSSFSLLLLSDMLSFFAYLFSFTPVNIDWRGKKYRVEYNGKIKKI